MDAGPQLSEIEATPYLGHRFEVEDGVSAAVDRAFGQVFGWLGREGIRPDGPPFIRYHEVDAAGAPLTMEVGLSVPAGCRAGGPLVDAALPAGRFVTYLHRGAYRSETEPDLATARERIERWAAERGLELMRRDTDRGQALGCYLERYLIGPNEEPDHSRWRTELAYLVAWP